MHPALSVSDWWHLTVAAKYVGYKYGARAKYAAGCYAKALSEGRGNGQMYSPKGKGLQKAYDKGALDYVNAQLGHGAGRYDVAVYNYLSYGSV